MFNLKSTKDDIVLPDNIVKNIINYYNPSINGKAKLLAKISKEAQLNKKKYKEVIKIIDSKLTINAKKGLTELKWNWIEFSENCNIKVNNLIKKNKNSIADFDNIDFENICLYYLEKGFSICTNCAPRPSFNALGNLDKNLYKLNFKTFYDEDTVFESTFNNNSNEWIIEIGEHIKNTESMDNIQDKIPDDYIAIWIKWDIPIVDYKYTQLKQNIISSLNI